MEPHKKLRWTSPTSCDQHNIQHPNSIQGSGALLLVDKDLRITQCSDNSLEILGITPSTAFDLHSINDILDSNSRIEFKKHIDALKIIPSGAAPDTFQVILASGALMNCAIHYLGSETIVELAHSNTVYTLFDGAQAIIDERNGAQGISNIMPANSLSDKGLAISNNDIMLSTVLLLELTDLVEEYLALHTTFEGMIDAILFVSQHLSGFHRVVAYQFSEDWNGEAIAERNTESSGLQNLKGLWFPSTDIPVQARKLYDLNKMFEIYDTSSEESHMICKENGAAKLDLTKAFLRGIHPMHVTYMKNMGVRATMSIALNLNGRLWGLVAMHKTTGTSPSFLSTLF